jgi:hydrogenase/urease accessory protein HupE
MSSPRRTRHRPGPLALVVLGWLVVSGGEVLAHDPGLSSLDVSVTSGAISVTLSIASSDVALIAPTGDPRPQLRALAREALRMSIDGETLSPLADEVLMKDGAAYLHLSFPIEGRPGGHQPRRLVIASDVPRRVSRGHREMMIVRSDDRVIVETLLDAGSDPVAINLDGLSPPAGRTARYFLELGVRHILSGYDHLLFLAGLILAARTVPGVLVALTAFTAAHSLSLALVVIGGIHAPPSFVEPLIAGSIVWVGLENLVRGGSRSRWTLVFGFGLIHGFGFAGALMELGLAQSASETVVGLLSFNMGVEAGQLSVAAFVVPLVWLTRRRPMWDVGVMSTCSMAMVIAGGYWLIDRLS